MSKLENELSNEGLHTNVVSFISLLKDLRGMESKGSLLLKDKFLAGDINQDLFVATKEYLSMLDTEGFKDEVEFLINSYRRAANAGKPTLFTDRVKDLIELGELNKTAGNILLSLLEVIPNNRAPKAPITSAQSRSSDPCGVSIRHSSTRC